jgi:hypothetical protein
LDTGPLRRVLDDWQVIDEGAIYLITPSGIGQGSAVRALGEWLAKHFRRPPWLGALP